MKTAGLPIYLGNSTNFKILNNTWATNAGKKISLRSARKNISEGAPIDYGFGPGRKEQTKSIVLDG